MPESRFSLLLNRQLSQTITKGEKEELASLIEQLDAEQIGQELQACWLRYEGNKKMSQQNANAILSSILPKRDEAPVVSLPSHRAYVVQQRWMRYSAAAIIVIALGATGWWVNRKNGTPPAPPLAVAASSAKSYIRNITLPDGSTVVLQAGGTIDYGKMFNNTSREVTLVGEAYFDVVHDPSRSFIIHTGSVNTTVLGTAFNIKAYPGRGNIFVSVTRGKVKVEDGHKLLAILTPNLQLDYEPSAAIISQQKVDAITIVTDWTQQDMVFDESGFETVAEVLKKRYGVGIRFENDELQKCPIHASFKGTEKLEKVLDIICRVQGAAWRIADDKTIVISGKGCGN